MLQLVLTELLKGFLDQARQRPKSRQVPDPRRSPSYGCYTLDDGSLVPLGDLGIGPIDYELEP